MVGLLLFQGASRRDPPANSARWRPRATPRRWSGDLSNSSLLLSGALNQLNSGRKSSWGILTPRTSSGRHTDFIKHPERVVHGRPVTFAGLDASPSPPFQGFLTGRGTDGTSLRRMDIHRVLYQLPDVRVWAIWLARDGIPSYSPTTIPPQRCHPALLYSSASISRRWISSRLQSFSTPP